MRLSFLIQLVLLVILIVGIYLIFSNGVSGRNKLILIVALIVIGVYLFSKLPFLRGYNEVIENPVVANTERIFEASDLKKSNGEFAISSWIYINDWNTKYGEEKEILNKGDDLITMKLGEYENNLEIKLKMFSNTSAEYQTNLLNLVKAVESTYSTSGTLSCSGDLIHVDGAPVVLTGGLNVTCDPGSGSVEIPVTIENINLQKWVNIIVAVNDRTLDVYINGKLVTSKAYDNIINTALINNNDLIVTPNGGFGGFVSKIQYYPHFITPKKAWEIYRGGFGDAFASALDKYNLSVSFYEDQVEKKKYWVF